MKYYIFNHVPEIDSNLKKFLENVDNSEYIMDNINITNKYEIMFGISIIFFILAFFISIFMIKETHCEHIS